jgi:hypothetical protein
MHVRRLLLVLFTLLIGLGSPTAADAHLFGGPPFLSINGKDAQNNASYLSVPSFVLPQDVAPGVYLVHKPIVFTIDLGRLPVPKEVAQQSVFRWYWEDGSTTPTVGANQSHTYDTVGSHLVRLEVLAPGETSYLTLDTVRVNVVETLGYTIPTVSIAVVKDTFTQNRPMDFHSLTTHDPSASISSSVWDFGDNTSSNKQNVSHSYSENDFLHFAYVEVVDSNGFKAETGVTVNGEKGQIRLTPLLATGSAVPLLSPTPIVKSGPSGHLLTWFWLALGGIVTLAGVASGMGIYRRANASRTL